MFQEVILKLLKTCIRSGNECEKYLWRDKWVHSDHRFASRVGPKPLSLYIDYGWINCGAWCSQMKYGVGSWIKRLCEWKLKRWREALECKSFKITRTKMEYIDCNFSGHIEIAETTVRINDHELARMGRLMKMLNIG